MTAKTHLFRSILVILLSFSVPVFSQEKEIVKLLNTALEQDLKIRPCHNHFNDTLKIAKLYTIANGILSIEIETQNGNHYIEKREVPLSKITAIGKGINVIFDTEPDAVKIPRIFIGKDKENPGEDFLSAMFFTGIRLQKNNNTLGKTLQKAFAKAGYKIDLKYWYG